MAKRRTWEPGPLVDGEATFIVAWVEDHEPPPAGTDDEGNSLTSDEFQRPAGHGNDESPSGPRSNR